MSAQPGQSCSPTPRRWYSAHAASISSWPYLDVVASAMVVPPCRVRGAYRDRVDVEVAGRVVNVSSPDKIMFPVPGLTKLDVVDFYRRIEEPLMTAIRGRPVLMQRFPSGVDGSNFFQKRVPKERPDWLETSVVSTPNGTTSEALVAADLAHIVWAVNLGCLGFHVWPNLARDDDHADELRIDLDPQPGLGFDEVRRAAVAVARELARRRPDAITDAWWKEERGDRVFVDFNQNAPHKTVFGAWSIRARPAAEVSTPFEWDELDDVDPEAFTALTVPDRVESRGDPWADIADDPQVLTPLLEMYDRDIASGLEDAPWPPVYPKMPGEPPRVSKSRARKDDDGNPITPPAPKKRKTPPRGPKRGV